MLDELYAKPPPPPATWLSGYDFDMLSPLVMHNLFLNVAKNLLKKVSELLKLFNLNEQFRAFANAMTAKFKDVKVSWLPILEWKFNGGYVSENWLVIVHVMKLFCSGAVVLLREYQYKEPPRHKSVWNVLEKIQWLSVRGIKVKSVDPKRKNPLKVEVDPVFDAELNKVGGPSPILMEPGFEKKLTKLICSYSGLVGCVMIKRSVDGVTSKECEWRVKQFLTLVHDFQLSVDFFSGKKQTNKYQAIWVKQFSYINLLMMPDALEKWGAMRSLWEGGVIGEGILRFVKSLAPKYARHPFLLLLTRFYQTRALTRAKLRNTKKAEEKNKGHEWIEECQVYNKLTDMQE
eukprot:scaffold155213_cov54-Attheya_sp.AAC.1